MKDNTYEVRQYCVSCPQMWIECCVVGKNFSNCSMFCAKYVSHVIMHFLMSHHLCCVAEPMRMAKREPSAITDVDMRRVRAPNTNAHTRVIEGIHMYDISMYTCAQRKPMMRCTPPTTTAALCGTISLAVAAVSAACARVRPRTHLRARKVYILHLNDRALGFMVFSQGARARAAACSFVQSPGRRSAFFVGAQICHASFNLRRTLRKRSPQP